MIGYKIIVELMTMVGRDVIIAVLISVGLVVVGRVGGTFRVNDPVTGASTCRDVGSGFELTSAVIICL